MNKKDLNLLSEAYQKISEQSDENWTGYDKPEVKELSFYDQIKETIVSNIIEIERQIREEASQGTLNTREVDQFLKELHNLLSLEIDKVKTKLKDIAIKSNHS